MSHIVTRSSSRTSTMRDSTRLRTDMSTAYAMRKLK